MRAVSKRSLPRPTSDKYVSESSFNLTSQIIELFYGMEGEESQRKHGREVVVVVEGKVGSARL